MTGVARLLTSVTLQAAGGACVLLANLPRGTRRAWSRYQPWDLLKARRIATRLGDGDAVLDVGCGTGHMLAELALFRDIRPHGVDLALHPRRFPDIPITTFDGKSLPFPAQHFDATLLCYVMHHLVPDEAAGLLAETVRVTRRTVFLLEDSLPSFGLLYRVRNRIHRIEAGLRYAHASAVYRVPPDEQMFLTHDGWRAWLGGQPGVAHVALESFADISQHDHHTLFELSLATRG
jgi:SAM-dependent methyltransferase